MRRPVAVLLAALLPLAGCHHRARTIAATPPPPDIPPVMVSVPPPTHTSEPLPAVPIEPAPPAPVAVSPVPPKKPHRRKPAASSPSTAAATTPASAPPVQVAAASSPAFALGQLSAGDDNGRSLRSETEALLATQRARLEKLPAAVVNAHASDVDQARRFLKGADDAWKTGDVEGAHTLAIKARVLLDDLGK